MPRVAIIPAPVFNLFEVTEVGRAIEVHLDIIVAIDDEWKDLIASSDDADLITKLKMNIIDAISGCVTGVGNVCPALILHRHDIELLWLDDYGVARFLSVKEVVRRRELLYAYDLEHQDGLKLFRLQTYKPLEPGRRRFFSEQFENLELEIYEMLYGSKDLERWRRITRVTALPAMAGAVAEAARKYAVELCIFGEYNVCPGMLLLEHGGRVDVKILKISAKAENYLSRIDLAGLLANRQPPIQPAP